MSHIKVWNELEKRYKTISESEGLEEFKEVKNLDELCRYMYKKSEFNVLYIDELNIIGRYNSQMCNNALPIETSLTQKQISLLKLFSS